MSPVKKIRKSLLLTQEQFGKLIGITRGSIYRYELGHVNPSNKTIRKMLKLAKEHNIDVSGYDFFKDEDEE